MERGHDVVSGGEVVSRFLHRGQATMSRILENKIALVTGGGQGLGQAISWRLAKEGCHVVVADLNEQAALETAAAILQNEAETGRKAIGLKVDVTDEAQVSAVVDRTVA